MNLLYFVALFVHCLVLHSVGEENNVCPTYADYSTVKSNPRCWYDFSANSNVTEIIKKHGYPVEIHKVVTSDGYILQMFRIPNYQRNGKKRICKRPVFIAHGMHGSCAYFVSKGKDSLGNRAFVLVDAGYEVWLGNYRGDEYSEEHTNLTVHDKQFWDYSIDEIALMDIPAQLEHIQRVTEEKGNIVFIGHSLGTTVALMYSSVFPRQARETIKLVVFLGPTVLIPNTKSPLFRLLAPFFYGILRLVDNLGLIRLTSQAAFIRPLVSNFCLESPRLMQYCYQGFVNSFVSGMLSQTGPEMVPVLFRHLPGGLSLKVVAHASDLVLNRLRRFNYGSRNLRKYGVKVPPAYNLSNFKIPVFSIYAVNDWIATEEDTLRLYDSLPPEAKVYGLHKITVPDFNHLDFVSGRNAKSIVYDRLLDLLHRDDQC